MYYNQIYTVDLCVSITLFVMAESREKENRQRNIPTNNTLQQYRTTCRVYSGMSNLLYGTLGHIDDILHFNLDLTP